MPGVLDDIATINDARVYAESIVETIREPLIILNGGLRILSANSAFYGKFHTTREQTEGRLVYEILNRQWDVPKLREALETVIPEHAEFYNFEAEYDIPGDGRRIMLLNGRRIDQEGGRKRLILIAIDDITERKSINAALRENEEKYRTLVERANDGIIIVQDGIVVFANTKMAGLDGSSVQELIGTPYTDHVHPSELQKLHEIYRRRMAGEKIPPSYETLLKRKDGSPAPSELNAALITYRGRPADLVIVRDISKRKKAENDLRRKEAEFRTLAENSPDIIIRFDRDCRFLYVNKKAEPLFGRPREEIIGRRNRDLGTPQEAVDFWEALTREIFSTKKEKTVEFLSPSGDRSFNARLVPEFDDKGAMISALSIARDVTQVKEFERKLARSTEEALTRANEAEEGRRVMQTIVENIPEGIFIADAPDSRIRIASSYIADMTGLPGEYFIGRKAGDIGRKLNLRSTAVSRTGQREYPIIRAVKYGETTINEEWQVTRPGGRIITILINARPITDREGRITGAVSAWRDISNRKRDEEILRRNEYEMKTLVDNSPDLIFRMDSDMRYAYVNAAYERITGIPKERLIGSTNRELGMSQQLSEFWEYALMNVFENGREHALEFEMASIFGQRYFSARLIPEFFKSGLVETVLVVARDTSERKRVEEHIRYLSFHDKATGLFNRAYFEEEITRMDTERELPISLIMGDVNHLKLTNDVFGHLEGDKLIKAIADALRKACRKSDIIARWGGDEYVVILPKTAPEVAREISGRIKQLAAETKGTLIRPSIAVGIAVKAAKEENINQVIRQAENQMYGNKIAESAGNKEDVLSSLLALARERTKDLTMHIERGRALVRRFAQALELDADQTNNLLLLIEMHDIGQAIVPGAILAKPGPLTEEEWKIVKKHPEAGFMILKSFPETAMISNDVLCHDERWDGTGYPRGLKGSEIPYLARIFSIIEAYDVMTHARRYARTLTHAEAVRELRRSAGMQFDPELVEIFLTRVMNE